MTENLCQMPWGNDGGWPWLCGRERPCPDHDQPATPGEALRLAAGRTNCLDDSELLTAMADELDAAPVTPGQLDIDAASELAEAADAVRADLELEQALHEIVRRAQQAIRDEPVWARYQWECRGCDADGYEWEPPEWPCSTIELITQEFGVTLEEPT